ncbi:UDP-2,3-diacylglucosamine diphosphatase [Tahibacter caeni]|uniref:UDP-2,3-diacylglucosamine diphosphatase n=1 Tax=Tahibacter caeni TaxID=1453545 RepID=UPI0021491573|nr:UDP-2,3-diacylglucosamine diphosphatase [Tahibacter caeni]
MAATLFISDLHLDDERPQITDLFLSFLRGEARSAPALYILGDLFESWIGDDDDALLGQRVQDALAQLAGHGVAVFFMAGNRDFLVGPRFAERSGLTLLADPTRVDLGGVPTLLMHGDTLCTDDTDYQKFRTVVRDPAWQQSFLAQPLPARRAFAAQARAQSREHTGATRAEIMDVTDAAVRSALQNHGAARLIHGHTHRPARHRVELGDRVAERIVLGDWYEQGSVLRVDGERIDLAGLG